MTPLDNGMPSGSHYWAYSDMDLQFVARSGRLADAKYVGNLNSGFVEQLNIALGKPLFQHGDNYNGLLVGAEGATRYRQDEMTLLINSSGHQGVSWGFDALAQIIPEGQWPLVVRILSR